MINIILCGGSGTRLWPISRQSYPKQFCKLIGNKSLFQHTVNRNLQVCDEVFVVTNRDHFFTSIDQIEEPGGEEKSKYRFLLEPVGRNTAPAIALACMNLNKEEIVLVTPSDHLITDEDSYKESVKKAVALAEKDKLVTFGIKPEYAETGYGYIEGDENISEMEGTLKVKKFHEKPGIERAEEYVASGNYFWNSGMFVFKAGLFLSELKKYSPDIYEASQKAYKKTIVEPVNGYKSLKIEKEDMMSIPADSIDYAVMEKTNEAHTVSSDIGWNDLGSFDSLYPVLDKDEAGNTVSGNLINIDSKNNLILAGEREVTLVGLENSIVVDTTDALLIGSRGESQLVKKAVDKLKSGSQKEKDLTVLHATVHRPWGTYTVLEESKNYKIKKIKVRPGKRISLQKHNHRSEHWTVVSGVATVTLGEEKHRVNANESTYIPIGEKHRLENEGIIDLVIIETQVGEYVGEDDIIRIEDDYNR